jgi:hypothetical protein
MNGYYNKKKDSIFENIKSKHKEKQKNIFI